MPVIRPKHLFFLNTQFRPIPIPKGIYLVNEAPGCSDALLDVANEPVAGLE